VERLATSMRISSSVHARTKPLKELTIDVSGNSTGFFSSVPHPRDSTPLRNSVQNDRELLRPGFRSALIRVIWWMVIPWGSNKGTEKESLRISNMAQTSRLFDESKRSSVVLHHRSPLRPLTQLRLAAAVDHCNDGSDRMKRFYVG
jgi:hypothetical protein